jgi:hypothetical protein
MNRDRALPVVLIVEDEWLVRDAIVEKSCSESAKGHFSRMQLGPA